MNIKFKAYIKQLDLMLDVKRINFDIETIEVCVGEDDFLHNDLSEYSFDDINMYQYSGYSDINGIEIYEGDKLVCGEDKIEFIIGKSNEGFVGIVDYSDAVLVNLSKLVEVGGCKIVL